MFQKNGVGTRRLKFTQSKFRMIHALCIASKLRMRVEKINETSVQANLQGHVSHYHEL